MFSKKNILSAISALFVLAAVNSYAVEMQVSGDVVAREASEGPRGADRVHTGTHKNSIDVNHFIIAREAGEGPRGEGKGHPNGIDASSMILAREASEGPRGADRVHTGTHA